MINICKLCNRYPCHHRCPNAPEPIVRGACERCGDDLREDYEYYTDNNDNKFCSQECAVLYHGIKSKDWNYEE